MQTLRRARFLARFVLAWFVMALGVAVAAPLVNPQSVELVCSAGGSVKLVKTGDEGSAPQAGHTLDCPLCMLGSAPPPVPVAAAALPRSLSDAPWPSVVVPLVGRTAGPPPSRGPPALA